MQRAAAIGWLLTGSLLFVAVGLGVQHSTLLDGLALPPGGTLQTQNEVRAKLTPPLASVVPTPPPKLAAFSPVPDVQPATQATTQANAPVTPRPVALAPVEPTPVALAPVAPPVNYPQSAPPQAAQADPIPPFSSAPTQVEAPPQVSPQTPAPDKNVPQGQASQQVLAIPTEQTPQVEKTAPAPEQPPEKPKPKKNIQLFGTVEFRGTLKNLTGWLSVMERNASNPIMVPGGKLRGNVPWETLEKQLTPLAPLDQLKAINTFWNKSQYREDIEVYRKEDYWATPKEFCKTSGDCEDYSIAKFYTLKAMGFPTSQMRIVVLKDTVRDYAHAVLAVYIDDKAYILDNLSPQVLEHTRYPNYLPQFSVNEDNRWTHVRPK